MQIDNFRNMLNDMVRDDGETLSGDDMDVALKIGLLKYSKDRPYVHQEQTLAPGGAYVPLPGNWAETFSEIVAMKTVDGEELKICDGWSLVETINGPKIKVIPDATAGESLYFDFTLPHTLDHQGTTVPEVDMVAVCHWSAAYLLDQLAAQYAGHQSPMVDADAINWQSKSQDYASRAKSHRAHYHDYLGIKQGKITASSATTEVDMRDSRGRARLTHKERFR